MITDPTVQRLDNILPELNKKLAENIFKSLAVAPAALDSIEIKARAIAILGELIRADRQSFQHQSKLAAAFDEVFADITLSAYLGACCLDNPACVVLRRAFETGIAIAFLWDSPCEFYAWSAHDKDLNFRAMVEFLSSDAYKTLLLHETSGYKGESVISAPQAEAVYRALSNVTHGKWSTFESAMPDRFSHNPSEWAAHILRITQIEDILLTIWRLRFPTLFLSLIGKLPALARV